MVKYLYVFVLICLFAFEMNAQNTDCNYSLSDFENKFIQKKVEHYIDKYKREYSNYEDRYVYVFIKKDSLGVTSYFITYSFSIGESLWNNINFLQKYNNEVIMVREFNNPKKIEECKMMSFLKENYPESHKVFLKTNAWQIKWLVHDVPTEVYYLKKNKLIKEDFYFE